MLSTGRKLGGRAASSSSDPADSALTPIDYRELFERTPDAILVTDRKGRCIEANAAACALTGYSREELPHMCTGDLYRRGEADGTPGQTDVHGATGMSHRSLVLRRKDGREIPVEVSTDGGEADNARVCVSVIRDATEHRNVVERLNDALQRLQFHVERMPLAYIVWDVNFRVVEWNPAAERLFGYTKAEALDRHPYDLIVPPDAVPAVDVVWRGLQEGDTSSHSINANVRKDGSRLACEWFNTPLRDSTGRIHGVASMVRDVSEREAAEARLRETQKLESLGLMAGGIAHDFNSSLMVILGNTALLRSTKGIPPRAIEHIELIEEAGSRAGELIKRLLAYARTGRHNPQPADLNTVIRDVLKFVQSSIGYRHELHADLAGGLAPIVADHSQIEQVLLNLCLNARDAMSDGGTIGIASRNVSLTASDLVRCVPHDGRSGRYVEMVVSDTGCGMDGPTMMRVFDPFFTTKVEGHGLGMAAVLGILRQHGAVARIDSQVGEGTRVHVFFPAGRSDGALGGSDSTSGKSDAAQHRTSRVRRGTGRDTRRRR